MNHFRHEDMLGIAVDVQTNFRSKTQFHIEVKQMYIALFQDRVQFLNPETL